MVTWNDEVRFNQKLVYSMMSYCTSTILYVCLCIFHAPQNIVCRVTLFQQDTPIDPRPTSQLHQPPNMPARDAEYWSGVEPGFHGPQLRDLPQQLQDPDLKNMIQNMSEDYFEELKELYENSHPWADQRPFEAHVISFDRHLRRKLSWCWWMDVVISNSGAGKPLPPDAESHLASTLISDLMSRFGVTSRQAPALVGLMYGTRDLMYDEYVHVHV